MGTRDVYEDHLKRFLKLRLCHACKGKDIGDRSERKGIEFPLCQSQPIRICTTTQSDFAEKTWLGGDSGSNLGEPRSRRRSCLRLCARRRGKSAATATALEKCRSNGGGNNCKIVVTWDKGAVTLQSGLQRMASTGAYEKAGMKHARHAQPAVTIAINQFLRSVVASMRFQRDQGRCVARWGGRQ